MLGSDRRGGAESAAPATACSLRFGLLGPLEVLDAGRQCTPTAPRLRTLLALLLVRANTVVCHSELVEELWGVSPPLTSGNTLQVFVRRLRRSLTPECGPHHPDQMLRTCPAGYSLQVAPDQVDVARFERLVKSARRTLGCGDVEAAAESLRAALALWRGAAFEDVPAGSLLQARGVALEEARLVALEDRIEADLRLARHRELVGELRILVHRHPLRESFWRQLMVALYRCGRQAEALDVYQRLRATLISELGLEPGSGARLLQRAILAGEPALDLDHQPAVAPGDHAAWVSAAQLPRDIGDFTGRSEPLARLCAVLSGGSPAASSAPPPVVVIGGRAGVGKTTLAVRAAHECRDAFPHGQLYAGLNGAAGPAVTPAEVLARFLRALGFDGAAIPDSVEERGYLCRSRLADRRVLIVLDDAADERQVRPLLPGGAGCAVLVTSRRRLSGLEAAVVVNLPPFSPSEAVELLGRLAGEQRVAADRAAAERVIELCGLLPLALRVAGTKLVARPHWSTADLAHRLADERRRLDELCVGDLDVRASLALSYQACGPAERRAFRLLACAPTPDFPAWVAAAACDTDTATAESVVERLVDVQLLQVAGPDRHGQLRYQLHDLLRVFAAERLAAEEPEEQRRAAMARVWGGYRRPAQSADAALQPGRPLPSGWPRPVGSHWAWTRISRR